MSIPKMLGLKQMFISLKLFGKNVFIDGKKVEKAHQIGKDIQNNHNNFRYKYKEIVSKDIFQTHVCSPLHIVNLITQLHLNCEH
jgi:hypothetical protein